MYRILIDYARVIQDGPQSGVSKTIYNLSKHFLKDNRYEFILVNIESSSTCKREQEKLCGLKEGILGENEICRFKHGDVLFLADCNYFSNTFGVLLNLIDKGVCIIPFLHDIIPVTHYQFIEKTNFYSWIVTVSNMKTGIICNSLFTAREFLRRFKYNYPIGYIHLGCDRDNFEIEPHFLPKGKNVLMVSTIEPRKMYDKTLEQFERIWETRDDINLIIIGKKGWCVDELMEKIETHPKRDKNLFNFSGLSETQLNYLYKNCDLFLFASEIEGFGLGVIEAARFGTPLLLRDIPVFREIAGDFATYFDEFDKLPHIINEGFESGFKRSEGMKINSWKDTADGCLKIVDGIRNKFLGLDNPIDETQKRTDNIRDKFGYPH